MSASGISFGGLATGMDTSSIISALISIERQPISRMRTQQNEISNKKNVYSSLKSQVSSFAQAAGQLNISTAFNPTTASSSDMSVAVLSGTDAATSGSYSLRVNKLATSNKISSAAKTDTATALGLTSGTFVVNGAAIDVDETDTLKTIAQKVNDANVGVTASLIDGGTGNAFLTLSSSTTGAKNKVQIADYSGNVASQLGLVSGTDSIREAITNGARSRAFSSNTDSVKTLLDANNSSSKTFTINGVDVTVDTSTDGLQAIADKINTAGAGATATVTSTTKDSKTTYQLEITGASSTPTITDTDGLLKAIGVMQKAYGNELVTAQDAEYKLDNVSLTSDTNTITTAIPGATLKLSKADTTDSDGKLVKAESTLTLSRDTSAIKSKIKGFTDAYNSLSSFITNNSKYDADAKDGGPLLGDTTAQQIESSLTTMLFNNVPGLTGKYKNMADIGFKFDSDGNLTADDTTLNKALAEDINAVAAIFRSTGNSDNKDITYVSSTSKTKVPASGSYNVNITQIATKGFVTANTAQTTASTLSEKLTFNGALFGSTPYALTLDIGSTLSSTVNKINNDSKLKDMVVAKIDSGKLVVQSKRFGTSNNFTLYSSLAASSDNSGVGHEGAAITAGVDVKGTINGAAATGAGQFLTGAVDSGAAEGLQIQYTGSDTGQIGSIQFRKGVATQSNDIAGTFTDAVNGLLTVAMNSMQEQMDSIDDQITDLNTRITTKQESLKARFAAMEESIAKIQSQTTSMSNMFASMQNS